MPSFYYSLFYCLTKAKLVWDWRNHLICRTSPIHILGFFIVLNVEFFMLPSKLLGFPPLGGTFCCIVEDVICPSISSQILFFSSSFEEEFPCPVIYAFKYGELLSYGKAFHS